MVCLDRLMQTTFDHERELTLFLISCFSSDKLPGRWILLNYKFQISYRMTPPPPKFGSRNLFNISFLPWSNNNKSQPAPTVHRLEDSPGGRDELQEKRYLLKEGHEFLDRAKSMLEDYSYILGREATKRLRKTAAK